MHRKQRLAIALNARLNYLIDAKQLSAEEIVVQMGGKVKLSFVENIMLKRINHEKTI